MWEMFRPWIVALTSLALALLVMRIVLRKRAPVSSEGQLIEAIKAEVKAEAERRSMTVSELEAEYERQAPK